jgi:hypothetical protein
MKCALMSQLGPKVEVLSLKAISTLAGTADIVRRDCKARRRTAPSIYAKKLHVVADQADLRCPVLTEKFSRFARRANLPQSAALISTPNQRHNLHYPAPTEGRFAIVTNVGRDAVDADGADDERRNRRTAKSCGPDAPTLASSLREATFAGDGGKKARSPGRARYKP